MRKLIVTEWTSLDGVIDAGSMEQWFNPYHSESRAKQIQETIQNCDAMLYGRTTYEMLFPYWSTLKNNEMGVAEKLNTVKKYLVSTTLKKGQWENTTVINSNVIKEITELKKQSGGNILVQGSATLVSTLLEAGLVDELKILLQPHIMGEGKNLFTGIHNIKLKLNSTKELENGVLALSFAPVKK